MPRVRYLTKAIEDVENIYEFIADDNLYYAEEVVEKIKKSIRILEDFPHIGTEIDKEHRYIVEPKYRYKVIYRIEGDTVLVISVFKYRESWKISDSYFG